ncbi:MAG: bifunctional 5,10-methylenetetrahydrofolate dehydrogenase/5,10-methenyltetrahydrofolate cyclohydrolase [Vampirovibrionales bacterium]|nr:bifunctional 5,10-methylenetetrahydrofolate dehydrogenase/5,10-methenyltetrahydrofolate cyclohydrolase [Vampirovibrionales bacterium]
MTTETQPLLLAGKPVADAILAEVKHGIQDLLIKGHVAPPQLVVIVVGDDPASHVYTQRKAVVAQDVGMRSQRIALLASTTQEQLLHHIAALNADADVHGILIQLPLPNHINTHTVLAAVDPRKDVDGFHPQNLGKLLGAWDARQNPVALPCTPAGTMTLLNHYGIELAGKHAVVVGRSTIVGKPLAQLLLQANATVTVCHSQTVDVFAHTRQADIVCVAIGRPGWLTADAIQPGAVVIDIGINRLGDDHPTRAGKLAGDVDFDSVALKASAITPVPGGIGPLTIATLMQNTLKLFVS